jgi:hypothetical protein
MINQSITTKNTQASAIDLSSIGAHVRGDTRTHVYISLILSFSLLLCVNHDSRPYRWIKMGTLQNFHLDYIVKLTAAPVYFIDCRMHGFMAGLKHN